MNATLFTENYLQRIKRMQKLNKKEKSKIK